jgi:hypothetical protein
MADAADGLAAIGDDGADAGGSCGEREVSRPTAIPGRRQAANPEAWGSSRITTEQPFSLVPKVASVEVRP